MTSGKPLSDQEKLFILKWVGKKTWGDIANDLKRDRWVVSRWYRDYQRSTGILQVHVPKDILDQIQNENKAIISFLFSKTVLNYLLAKSL